MCIQPPVEEGRHSNEGGSSLLQKTAELINMIRDIWGYVKGKMSKRETITAQSFHSEVAKKHLGSVNSKGETIYMFPSSTASTVEALNVLLSSNDLTVSFVSFDLSFDLL